MRPQAKIDWNVVDGYLRAHCDGVGIAGVLGIHPDTLYKRCQEENNMGFSEYSAQKKAEGKTLIRAKQFQMAMDGDRSMNIWLGKQYLDQRDRSDLNTIVTGGLNLVAPSEAEAEIIKRLNDRHAADSENS